MKTGGGRIMQKTNPTRAQKIYFASYGLKPDNWYIEKETKDYFYLVSKNGRHRLIDKTRYVKKWK